MDNKKIAQALIKLAKNLAAADEDKAYEMLKDSLFVAKELERKTKYVVEALKDAERDIKGLEALGSARIEAPNLLKKVAKDIDALHNFVTSMKEEVDKAL